MTVSLGLTDADISSAQITQYLDKLKKLSLSQDDKLRSNAKSVGFREAPKKTPDAVSQLQQQLTDTGFFPGGVVDGICGFRTQSAIRLFQEYIRSVDGKACLPDGIAGPITKGYLHDWIQKSRKAYWDELVDNWRKDDSPLSEYDDWLGYLQELKQFRQQQPGRILSAVNEFSGSSDTKPVAQWTHSKEQVHLLAVRCKPDDENRRFDDIFILLIKGLVFKFQGSSDPGYTKHPQGAPFLVPGQHDYRFGLHRNSYPALRPMHFAQHGVLTVRSRNDFRLTEEDLDNGLEVNGSINIHWGGKGVGRAVNRWSEGCQVITGSGYLDSNGEIRSCAEYVAINNGEVNREGSRKTRGAYTVLSDLLVAFTSDLAEPGLVKFTLIPEQDLALNEQISNLVSTSRTAARELIRRLA